MQEPTGRRVLMLDDDVVTTGLYEHILPAYGYSIRTCSTFDETLQVLGESEKPRFDVLITDFCLHDSKGRMGTDLALWAREKFPMLHIILASGCIDHMDLPPPLRSDVHLLLKPWSPEQLVSMLDAVANRAG